MPRKSNIKTKEHLVRAIKRCSFSVVCICKSLHITHHTLYKNLKKYGLADWFYENNEFKKNQREQSSKMPDISRDELIRLIDEENLFSIKDIMYKFDLTKHYATKLIKQHNIDLIELRDNKIIDLFNAGFSYQQIADFTLFTKRFVSKLLKRKGLRRYRVRTNYKATSYKYRLKKVIEEEEFKTTNIVKRLRTDRETFFKYLEYHSLATWFWNENQKRYKKEYKYETAMEYIMKYPNLPCSRLSRIIKIDSSYLSRIKRKMKEMGLLDT